MMWNGHLAMQLPAKNKFLSRTRRSGGQQIRRKAAHTCNPKQHLKINSILSAQAKAYALNNLREPPLKIVEPMTVETLEKNPSWDPIATTVLARAVSRAKEKLFTKNPSELFFNIKHENLPGNFFRGRLW
jgi:hypothetical protein